MNDEEWEIIEEDVEELEQEYTAELYTSVLLVLDSREVVSDVRDRLGFYFQAKGADISGSETPVDASKILIGGKLE